MYTEVETYTYTCVGGVQVLSMYTHANTYTYAHTLKHARTHTHTHTRIHTHTHITRLLLYTSKITAGYTCAVDRTSSVLKIAPHIDDFFW